MKILLPLLCTIGLLFTSCKTQSEEKIEKDNEFVNQPTNEVLLSSEIIWEKLNPARGDQSPQAGTIWGDRNGTVATGFLAKFVDGFSSPPHIHNVTYRAVVLKGLVHNDDPDAENMWMPSGSFWTQPAGEPHITSAQSDEVIAYVEIDNGPYLVKPTDQAFDNGERPVNVDASNIVWLNNEKTNWVEKDCEAEVSFLWEDQQNKDLKGLFVKIPPGFIGILETEAKEFHSIVISGVLKYTLPIDKSIKELDAGSHFSSAGKAVHVLSNSRDEDIIIYIRTTGKIFIK